MTTATNLWADLFAEVWSADPNGAGPTGEFVEVLEVAVVDHGGNECGRARSGRELERVRGGVRVPTRLNVLATGRPCAGGEYACGVWTR